MASLSAKKCSRKFLKKDRADRQKWRAQTENSGNFDFTFGISSSKATWPDTSLGNGNTVTIFRLWQTSFRKTSDHPPYLHLVTLLTRWWCSKITQMHRRQLFKNRFWRFLHFLLPAISYHISFEDWIDKFTPFQNSSFYENFNAKRPNVYFL